MGLLSNKEDFGLKSKEKNWCWEKKDLPIECETFGVALLVEMDPTAEKGRVEDVKIDPFAAAMNHD